MEDLKQYYHMLCSWFTDIPESAVKIAIHETHEMISNFLGIHTRTLERHIRAFKQEGLISTVKGKVSISPSQYQALMQYITSNL